MNPVTWPERAITKAAAKRLEMRLYRFWLRSPEYKSELRARAAASRAEADRERKEYMESLRHALGAAYEARDCLYLGCFSPGSEAYYNADGAYIPAEPTIDKPRICDLDARGRRCTGKCTQFLETSRPTWKRKAAHADILFPPFRFNSEQRYWIANVYIVLGVIAILTWCAF